MKKVQEINSVTIINCTDKLQTDINWKTMRVVMFCWMSWFGNKSKGVFSLLFCIYVSIIAKDISHLRQPQENVPLFYCNKLKVKFGFFPVFIHLTSLSRYHLNQTLFFVLLPFCQFTSCHFRTCPSLPALVSHVFLPLQIFWPPHPPAHLLPVPPLAPHFMPLQPLFPACSIQVFLLSCVIFFITYWQSSLYSTQ